MRIKGLSKPAKSTGNPSEQRLPEQKPKSAFGRAFGAAVMAQLLGSWAVSQWADKTAGFPAGVAGDLGGHMVAPWAAAQWVAQGLVASPLFKTEILTGYGLSVAATAMAFFATYKVMNRKFRRAFDKKKLDLHGSAHWASKEELLKMNLLDQQTGVYVGGYEDPETGKVVYLRHSGPEHILVFAPTRSGKGVGIVLPNLLEWRESMFVYDIKGELWALTAGFRKAIGQRVFRFSPAEPYSNGNNARFNPLDEIRLRTPYEVSDVQNIALMLVDSDGKGLGGDHWRTTAMDLLTGVILHVMYSEKEKNLRGVSDFLSQPGVDIRDVLLKMINTKHDEERFTKFGGTCPTAANAAQATLNKSDNELSGVVSTAMTALGLYADDIVAENTSCSDFKVTDLVNQDDPVSVYIVTSPADKERLRPIIRLLINQILRSLTREMKFENGRAVSTFKHKLLFLLDEFPSLGKLDVVQESLAFVAGYGIKMLLITQDLSQLYAAYTREEMIMGNCHLRIAYAPNKPDTADILSKMAGTATIWHETQSLSGKKSGLSGLDGLSQSDQYVSRPLLTPDEAMRLRAPEKGRNEKGDEVITRAGAELIFVAGSAPVMAIQILYFQHKLFNARSKMPAPVQSDSFYFTIENGEKQTIKATMPVTLKRKEKAPEVFEVPAPKATENDSAASSYIQEGTDELTPECVITEKEIELHKKWQETQNEDGNTTEYEVDMEDAGEGSVLTHGEADIQQDFEPTDGTGSEEPEIYSPDESEVYTPVLSHANARANAPDEPEIYTPDEPVNEIDGETSEAVSTASGMQSPVVKAKNLEFIDESIK
ncbi:type IV secretory system conjugative DNA transfer family protein [Acidithiobacillus ferriphilus]|uniref:type IV secretory system conjugative DNA transfer family protein n=1 Tax=Acidithiobacillus ferriphilus TaxID=1689834 RepID=UPI001C0681FC|nr:type IV secretory system conjugative DNA transfer family protein [Acidithiobacillus ferriphilus]MBU2853467.1 type IV secretory system conjugative DNA transfer family protein [Acidithiobacillus ferriphilus]